MQFITRSTIFAKNIFYKNVAIVHVFITQTYMSVNAHVKSDSVTELIEVMLVTRDPELVCSSDRMKRM